MRELIRARDRLDDLDRLFEGLHSLGALVGTCDDANCYQAGITTLIVMVADAGVEHVRACREALPKD